MKNKKTLLIISTILVLAGLSFLGYWYYANQKSENPASDVAGNSDSDINYGPPTEVEKRETEQHKKDIGSDPPDMPASDGKVTPVITAYGQTAKGVEVGSRVPGIIENDGICTLILKKGSQTVKQIKKSVANASETSCGFITIARTKLSAGNWTAQISYSSQKYSGQSETVTIEVK